MEREAMQEIRVLDKGMNFDGDEMIIMMALCCGGWIIPLRWK